MMNEKKQKRHFSIDDMFHLKFINEACLSHDAKWAVYTLVHQDEKKGEEYSELWLMEIQTGRVEPLTAGDWNDYSPAWSPDGKEIAFISTRNGIPQLYTIRPQGGEACKRTSLARGCKGPLIWSPDGKWIAFHSSPSEIVDLTVPFRVRRAVYRVDGAGYTDNFAMQVYVLPVEGGEPLMITQNNCHHTATSWSPDSSRLLVLENLDPASISMRSSITIVSLKGELQQILSKDWGILNNAIFLPSGQIIFVGVEKGKLYGTKKDLWVMDSDGQKITCRSTSVENGVGGQLHDDLPIYWNLGATPLFSFNGSEEIITTVQNGGTVNIYAFATRGDEKYTCLAKGERVCYPLSVESDKVLMGISTPFDPTQLAIINLTSQEEHMLTHLNASLLETIEMPHLENLHFKGSDDTSVEGWLMKPQGNPPYPTILHIHGGPHVGYGYGFYFDFLTLAGAGYAVLFINHRGSTGYGSNFATGINGDWGNLEYNDLMAGVDYAIEKGLVDPDRMGCCGVSGGGYLSCWIVGHTDRFKAAVPENPVTNWFSHYGTSDVGPIFDVMELGGKPHENPEVYLRCSPFYYAHRCKTPTLLIQAENDYRCPAEQSEQFYTILRANGCVAEMVRFPGGSHGCATYGSLAARKMHNEVLLEWMHRYVLDKGD